MKLKIPVIKLVELELQQVFCQFTTILSEDKLITYFTLPKWVKILFT